MGSHCIFKLRDRNNKEILPGFFAVHMDTSHRVVMLHCAYQNSIDPNAEASVAAKSIPCSRDSAYRCRFLPTGDGRDQSDVKRTFDTLGCSCLGKSSAAKNLGPFQGGSDGSNSECDVYLRHLAA